MFDAVDLAKALDDLRRRLSRSYDTDQEEIEEVASELLSEITEFAPDFDEVDESLAWEKENRKRESGVFEDELGPRYITCTNVVLFSDNECECFGGSQNKPTSLPKTWWM